MVPTVPETSLSNGQPTPRNVPEQRTPQIHHDGSLKSRQPQMHFTSLGGLLTSRYETLSNNNFRAYQNGPFFYNAK
jgi:hypothetical protein